jgi:hypothetical protein
VGLAAWHWARARHHLAFANDTEQHLPTYIDWAAVGLFYSALHTVHAALDGETSLPKDERHPRKHSAPKNAKVGGRGTNQLVRDLYGPASFAYRSLIEASHRTRYDFKALPAPYARLLADHKVVHDHIHGVLGAQGVTLPAFR